MNIDLQLVQKLAKLSGLHLSADEQHLMQQDLQKMLDFVHRLEEVDTTGVAPLQHMTVGINAERNDEVYVTGTQNKALQGAPDADAMYFRVPKVIKK